MIIGCSLMDLWNLSTTNTTSCMMLVYWTLLLNIQVASLEVLGVQY